MGASYSFHLSKHFYYAAGANYNLFEVSPRAEEASVTSIELAIIVLADPVVNTVFNQNGGNLSFSPALNLSNMPSFYG